MKTTCLRQHLEDLKRNPRIGEKRHDFEVKITEIGDFSLSASGVCSDGCGTRAEIMGEDLHGVNENGTYAVRGLTDYFRDEPVVMIYSG